MRATLSVLAVNAVRAKGRPWYVVMTSSFMLVAMLVAVLISAKVDPRPVIAYVGEGDSSSPAAVSAGVLGDGSETVIGGMFRVEFVEEAPPVSQLMRNRFDAVVIDRGGEKPDIVTVKGAAFRGRLEAALAGPAADVELPAAPRGVGATIVGYLVMFMLISGSTYMNFFTDDKRGGTFRRVATSPPGLPSYLAGQLLFNGAMLFVPAMIMLAVLRTVFGMEIGFSLGEYSLLLALLTALSTAFGFFIAATVEDPDDGMAVAAAAIIVTSLLAGAFFAFEHEDAFMKVLTGMLPQKSLLAAAEILERGLPGAETAAQLVGPVAHVVGAALLLVAGGWFVCRRRFRAGAY